MDSCIWPLHNSAKINFVFLHAIFTATSSASRCFPVQINCDLNNLFTAIKTSPPNDFPICCKHSMDGLGSQRCTLKFVGKNHMSWLFPQHLSRVQHENIVNNWNNMRSTFKQSRSYSTDIERKNRCCCWISL